MATLPDPPAYGLISTKTTRPAFVSNADDGGGTRSRNLWADEAADFTVQYRFLSAADVATIETFYDANRSVDWSLPWKDGKTYTVVFTGVGRSFDVDPDDSAYYSGFIQCSTSTPA